MVKIVYFVYSADNLWSDLLGPLASRRGHFCFHFNHFYWRFFTHSEEVSLFVAPPLSLLPQTRARASAYAAAATPQPVTAVRGLTWSLPPARQSRASKFSMKGPTAPAWNRKVSIYDIAALVLRSTFSKNFGMNVGLHSRCGFTF